MPFCSSGHPLDRGERFCRRCGAPAKDGVVQASGLLPPFDAERFRQAAGVGSEADGVGRTVPMWVLLAVIVVGLALGAVLGAFG